MCRSVACTRAAAGRARSATDLLLTDLLQTRPCSLSYNILTYLLHRTGRAHSAITYLLTSYLLQAVLAQLDELRRVNRQLRMHALEFGWEWEPATQSLVMARNRRGVAASLDRQEKRSCSPKRHQRASSRQVRAADAPLTASDREEEAGEGEEGGAAGGDTGGEACMGSSSARANGPKADEFAACAARSASAGGRRRKRNNVT